MIYDFGSYIDIFRHLQRNLPNKSIMQIAQPHKLEKFAKAGDMVIFYGWSEGFRKCQKSLMDKGVILLPDGKTSLKLGDKVGQLKYVNSITKFPLERVYAENPMKKGVVTRAVPKLKSSDRVVVKIGNSHQGKDKYLKAPGFYFSTKENVIFEQFVDNARSLRVGIIEGKHIFIVEHVSNGSESPKESWIKNICPEEIVYSYENRAALGIKNIDEIIEDAKNIQQTYNMGYIGVDYVVSDTTTGILEVNDMIGLPNNAEVRSWAKEYWLKVCKEHLGI